MPSRKRKSTTIRKSVAQAKEADEHEAFSSSSSPKRSKSQNATIAVIPVIRKSSRHSTVAARKAMGSGSRITTGTVATSSTSRKVVTKSVLQVPARPKAKAKKVVVRKIIQGANMTSTSKVSLKTINKKSKSIVKRKSVVVGKSVSTKRSQIIAKRNNNIKVDAPKAKFKGRMNTAVLKQKTAKVPAEARSTSPPPDKNKKSNRKFKGLVLSPRPFIFEYAMDPTFYSNETIPFISPMAQSRLLIRAVIRKDQALLQKLIKDKKSIYSYCVPKSLDVDLDALAFAFKYENLPAIKVLMNEKDTDKMSPYSEWLIEQESTGHGSRYMFGHALKSVTVGRGAKEGNSALLKDKNAYQEYSCPRYRCSFGNDHITVALESKSMSLEFLQKALDIGANSSSHWYGWLSSIMYAVRAGNNNLAADLIKKAIERDGFGFNNLHYEALIKTKQSPLSPFKPQSVPKKSIGNARITPIHCAAINSDPYVLSTLLGVFPEYNILDANGWTPMHYASASSGTGCLEYLIGHGISTNQVNKDGDTPLHIACKFDRARNVKIIMATEAKLNVKEEDEEETSSKGKKSSISVVGNLSVNRPNKKGLNPFHVACQYGSLSSIKNLFQFDSVDVNKSLPSQYEKLTGLILACQRGHLDVVKELVLHGAKLDLPDRRGRTTLAVAVLNGHAHIVSYLLRLGDNHLAKDSSGNSLIHYAAAYGWYFNLKLLLEAGVSPDEPNQWKMTPMAIAFMKGHIGIVDILLKQPGVNVDSVIEDTKGMTLLLQTCSSKPSKDMISRLRFLVEEQQANCSIVDYQKNNALHYIMESESKVLKEIKQRKERGWDVEVRKKDFAFEATKLLLDNAINIESQNEAKETPILLGISLCCFELVEKVLAYTSTTLPIEQNSIGDTVLHILASQIAQTQEISAVSFYKKLSKNSSQLIALKVFATTLNNLGQTPLLECLNKLLISKTLADLDEKRKLIIMEFLEFLLNKLESNVNISEKETKLTPLHYVAQITFRDGIQSDILKLLLSKKPNIDPVDQNGRTPICLSIKSRNHSLTKQLIQSGSNVNYISENDEGKSMILLEASHEQNPDFSLIPIFIEKGARVIHPSSIQQKNGNTILHFACKSPESPGVIPSIISLVNTAKVPVNVTNKNGRTPLQLAVNSRSGETDVSFDVEYKLLELGANPIHQDTTGKTCLHYAFSKIGKHHKGKKQGNSFMDPIELVTILTDSAKTFTEHQLPIRNLSSFTDNDGKSILHSCAMRGSTISASHLITHYMGQGAINQQDNEGNTPFGLSVFNGHEGCSLMFLQGNANFLSPLSIPYTLTIKDELENTLMWEPVKVSGKNWDSEKCKRSKYPIIQEIVRKDWQGLLYLILEKLKRDEVNGIQPAIQAALRTKRLKLGSKLIKHMKKPKDLNQLTSILATLCDQDLTNSPIDIQAEILTGLTNLGLIFDSSQCIPLTQAAANWNIYLCNEITTKLKTERINELRMDSINGGSPFGALFWNPEKFTNNSEIPTELKKWALEFLCWGAGGDGNILANYQIQNSDIPALRYKLGIGQTLYSPLVVSILYGNYKSVKWLLSGLRNKVDVNFSDSDARTPLMHAVRLNDIRMVKLILNPKTYDPESDKTPWCTTMKKGKSGVTANETSNQVNKVDLSLKDKNGWSVIHHLICPFGDTIEESTLTYASAEKLLDILVQAGAKIDETCVALARKLKRFKILEKMCKLIGKKSDFEMDMDHQEESNTILNRIRSSDLQTIPIQLVQQNAKSMISKLIAEKLDKSKVSILFKAEPDSLSGLTLENSEILTVAEIPFDTLLTQVDLGYGMYGLYNFYKMQLIRQTKGQDLIYLFTRWGRVGDKGQYQKTPFPSEEEAIKEFKKIFRSKTGNVWDELVTNGWSTFIPMPKRYRLVSLEKRSPKFSTEFERIMKIDFESIENSHQNRKPEFLNDTLVELMKSLLLEFKTISITESTNEAKSFLPFGYLDPKALKEAESILDRIDKEIIDRNKVSKNIGEKPEDNMKILNSIVSLSEEYFTLIPVRGYAFEAIKPLFDLRELRQQQQIIQNLLHYEFGSQLLLGAQFIKDSLNPYEYIYRSLGTRLEILRRDSQECQLILEYIYNTSEEKEKPIVKNIYKVEIPGQVEKLNRTGVKNHHLLWHGTKARNVPSILHGGLKVQPLGYSLSGSLFGKGIYFSDMFAKSMKYCDGENKSHFMFLCEVGLGNIQKVELERYNQYDSSEPLKPSSNSLKTSNSEFKPLPDVTVEWRGRTLPLGPKCKNIIPEDKDYGLTYNEYIVFNPDQVNIQYLIEFKGGENRYLPEIRMDNIFLE